MIIDRSTYARHESLCMVNIIMGGENLESKISDGAKVITKTTSTDEAGTSHSTKDEIIRKYMGNQDDDIIGETDTKNSLNVRIYNYFCYLKGNSS